MANCFALFYNRMMLLTPLMISAEFSHPPLVTCFKISRQSNCGGVVREFELCQASISLHSGTLKTTCICFCMLHLIASQYLAYIPANLTHFAHIPIQLFDAINNNRICQGIYNQPVVKCIQLRCQGCSNSLTTFLSDLIFHAFMLNTRIFLYSLVFLSGFLLKICSQRSKKMWHLEAIAIP